MEMWMQIEGNLYVQGLNLVRSMAPGISTLIDYGACPSLWVCVMWIYMVVHTQKPTHPPLYRSYTQNLYPIAIFVQVRGLLTVQRGREEKKERRRLKRRKFLFFSNLLLVVQGRVPPRLECRAAPLVASVSALCHPETWLNANMPWTPPWCNLSSFFSWYCHGQLSFFPFFLSVFVASIKPPSSLWVLKRSKMEFLSKFIIGESLYYSWTSTWCINWSGEAPASALLLSHLDSVPIMLINWLVGHWLAATTLPFWIRSRLWIWSSRHNLVSCPWIIYRMTSAFFFFIGTFGSDRLSLGWIFKSNISFSWICSRLTTGSSVGQIFVKSNNLHLDQISGSNHKSVLESDL